MKVCDSSLVVRLLDDALVALLILLRFLVLHYDTKHLILETVKSNHEVKHRDLDTDFRAVVGARELSGDKEAEVA